MLNSSLLSPIGPGMYSSFTSNNMYNSYTQTFTSRFVDTLKGTTSQKFIDLCTLIQEAINTNNKEINSCYSLLVENLFAFGNQSKDGGLNLQTVGFSTLSVTDSSNLFSFMHPDGALFALIRHLMTDHLFRCEFPSNCLPPSSKLLIEEGITPHFYANRLSSDPIALCPTKVSLNALEFFLFHFAHFVSSNQTLAQFSAPSGVANTSTSCSLYFNLLEVYLTHFLPLSSQKDRISVDQTNSANHHSIWKSLSFTTSNLLHLGSSDGSFVEAPQTTNTQPKSLLLNLKPFQTQQMNGSHLLNSTPSGRMADSLGALVYKCETIITIFTEMWLNVAIPTSLLKKKQTNLQSHVQLLSTHCPNVDHMRCVRILVKHLHYFANSVLEKGNDVGNMPAFENPDLDDIKKSVWSSKFEIQKKLYSFIKLAFERWPCDASFKVPLETWLSYIQPWRYTNAKQLLDENKENGDTEEANVLLNTSSQVLPLIESRWKMFIADNLLFYTVLFRELIPRFTRIDLASSKNAYMLFRVCKIFAQTNLCYLIQEVESQFDNPLSTTSWLASSSIRGSLLSPSIRNASQSLRAHTSDTFLHLIEDNDEFEYSSFFSAHVTTQITKLLIEVKKTRIECEAQQAQTASTTSSASTLLNIWRTYFASADPADVDKETSLADQRKALNYLKIVYEKFSAIFEIDTNELETMTKSMKWEEDIKNKSMSLSFNYSMEIDSPDEKRLKQLKRKEIRYQGNPDQQPVRTFEFYYLVLLLGYASSFFNDYYGEQLIKLYYRTDLLGYFFKKLLSPPVDYIVVEKNGPRVERQIKKKLPPRVNLRPLASKRLYIYVSLLVLLYNLYSLSKVFLFIVVLLTSIIFISYKLVNMSDQEMYGKMD